MALNTNKNPTKSISQSIDSRVVVVVGGGVGVGGGGVVGGGVVAGTVLVIVAKQEKIVAKERGIVRWRLTASGSVGRS